MSARARLARFLRRQIRDLREGGVPVAWRKALMSCEMLLAIPFVLVVRLLRPLLAVRFAGLPTEGMGTLAATLEIYLCEREAGLHGRRAIDLFCRSQLVCNEQLTKMWERVVPMSRFIRAAERVNRWLPGGRGNRVPWERTQCYDLHGLLAHTRPHIAFTAQEEAHGRAELRRIGVGDGAGIVCFYARDAAYYLSRPSVRSPTAERQHDHRNSEIRAQVPAMHAMAQRGYVAVRMGAGVSQRLGVVHPRILDYAIDSRTDFLDVYLCARCHFFLGDSGGLASVPMVFRRPVAMVNSIPLEYAWSWAPQDLFLPKLLWLRSEQRLLTFPEIMGSRIGRLMDAQLYEQAGIDAIDNTPEDIAALAVEMDERLKGTWQTHEEDEERQRRFWKLFAHSKHHRHIRSRIGAAFLRQHQALLEAPARRVQVTA